MTDREALRRIEQMLSAGDRETVNPSNVFEHWNKLNQLLVEIRTIAREQLK